jgi:hypothetical protein
VQFNYAAPPSAAASAAQQQDQAQQQAAIARAQQELNSANQNYTSVMSNPNSTAAARAAAQTRVDVATTNLISAQGGAGGQGTGVGTGTANAGGANVATTTITTNRASTINAQVAQATQPIVQIPQGGVKIESKCGPLMELYKSPIEILFSGYKDLVKVTLKGLENDELRPVMELAVDEAGTPLKDSEGKTYMRPQKFEVVDNGDGSFSWIGSIYTMATVPVPASVVKNLSLFAAKSETSGGGSMGAASALSVNQKFIALGSCEFRRFNITPAKVEVKFTVSATAATQAEVFLPATGPIAKCTTPTCVCGKTSTGRTVTAENKPGACIAQLRAAGLSEAEATAVLLVDDKVVASKAVKAKAGQKVEATLAMPK